MELNYVYMELNYAIPVDMEIAWISLRFEKKNVKDFLFFLLIGIYATC